MLLACFCARFRSDIRPLDYAASMTIIPPDVRHNAPSASERAECTMLAACQTSVCPSGRWVLGVTLFPPLPTTRCIVRRLLRDSSTGRATTEGATTLQPSGRLFSLACVCATAVRYRCDIVSGTVTLGLTNL